MMGIRLRLAAAGLLGAVAFGTFGVPVAQADAGSAPCRVRNITQQTAGRSFLRMVEAAVHRDRLHVRGVCTSVGVVVRRDIVIEGVGDRLPVLTARRRGRVLLVWPEARVTVRHVVVTGGRGPGGSGIHNLGTLTLADARVRRSGPTAIWNEQRREVGGLLRLVDVVVEDNPGLAILNGGEHGSGGLVLRRTIVRRGGGGGIHTDSPALLVDSRVARNAGQGIHNRGSLTLRRSVITRNRAGGIGNVYDGSEDHGRVLLIGSIVARNASAWEGGGIRNEGGLVTIRESWVNANRTARSGGGIYNGATHHPDGPEYGRVVIRDSSAITRNEAAGTGGGVHNDGGRVELAAAAISGNTAQLVGGGIWNGPDPGTGHDGTVVVDVTGTVAGNTPDECFGTTAC